MTTQAISNYWASHGGRWNHWPNPFDNMVKKIEVLACEDTFQAKLEMLGIGFGNWFWSSFIPSPIELTRKTATGSYKCGFYSKLKFKSPLDIIWRDGRTSKGLGEIIRPVTSGLFYMWAASTAWEAMSTWTSMVYAMEMCEADNRECLLRDGNGTFPVGTTEGNPALYTVMHDPQGVYGDPGGFINVGQTSSVNTHAYGYLVANGHEVSNIEYGVIVNGIIRTLGIGGDLHPFEQLPLEWEWAGTMEAGAFAPWIKCTVAAGGILPVELFMRRWTSRVVPSAGPVDWGGNVRAPDVDKTPLCRGFHPEAPWVGNLG